MNRGPAARRRSAIVALAARGREDPATVSWRARDRPPLGPVPLTNAAMRADLQDGLPTLPIWMQSVVREVLDEPACTAGATPTLSTTGIKNSTERRGRGDVDWCRATCEGV